MNKRKIVFTKHAKKRLEDFTELGLFLSETKIIQVINHPEHIDAISDAPKMISSGKLDASHILRVVYKIEDGIITVITFYPAKRGRYYEN